jgi:SAM-dependent methyltransferase
VVDGEFSLVYLVYNTIENVTSQAGQVAAFRNAARHLAPGGVFVIECLMPELRRLPEGATAVVFDIGERHWGIDEYDVANHGLVSHHFNVVDGRVEYGAWPFRYVWPAELDLMAELAGLRLRERWGGWNREPFVHERQPQAHLRLGEAAQFGLSPQAPGSGTRTFPSHSTTVCPKRSRRSVRSEWLPSSIQRTSA